MEPLRIDSVQNTKRVERERERESDLSLSLSHDGKIPTSDYFLIAPKLVFVAVHFVNE